MKTLVLFVTIISCKFFQNSNLNSNQINLQLIQNAIDSVNASLSRKIENFKPTDNSISPQIVPLLFSFFTIQINDVKEKENLKFNEFPSSKFDYQNRFKIFQDEGLKKKYNSNSNYVTFFTKPVHNFIIAEVIWRGDKTISDYKTLSMFGESDYFLFYFDDNFKIKYVYDMTVHNN